MILIGRLEKKERGTGSRQEPRSRFRLDSLLLLLAGIAILGSLVFPLWRISLQAPQYPEGMGMQIWANTIQGDTPQDLNIINELNHYIGMKKIIPESIPELRIILPLILAFAAACFAAAWRPRLWSSALLLSGLTAIGGYGLFDFWKWEYDYGHNLNPTAAIKIPGMTYQPPLIGQAKLLNFLSTSWPATGACLLFLAGSLIGVSLCLSLCRKRGWHPLQSLARIRHPSAAVLLLGLPGFFLPGCRQQGPAPFLWGEDACHFCQMTLVQKGFAAQRITAKGKVYKYDSIECLLRDLKASPLRAGDRVYVSDRSRPDAEPIEASQATFLQGGKIKSPMGSDLAAFQTKDSAAVYQGRLGGKVLAWSGLKLP